MNIKKLLTIASATALFTLGGISLAKDINSHTIRFGFGLAADSPTGIASEFFRDKVAELSDGKMKVRLYPNGALGPDEQLIKSLISGSGEVTYVSTAPLTAYVKELGVYDLPFLFDNYEVADTVLDGPEGKKLLDALDDTGLVGLAYWENGYRNLTNSKHAIKKASDLNDIKLRVMQNEVAIAVFNKLGANAIPMQFTELFTAMETKTVDGQENPLSTIQTSKFYEVQNNLTLSKHMYTPFIFMASKRWWDKLTDDEKEVIQTAAIETREVQRKLSREAEVEALEYLQEQGMTVSEFNEEELAKIKEAVQPVIDELRPKIGADTVDSIMKAAAEAAGN